MRLGFVFNERLNNSYYRARFPAEALQRRGHEVVLVPRPEQGALTDDLLVGLRGVDAVLFYRLMHPSAERFVDRLRERRVAVVWDNDDDPRLIPAHAWRMQRSKVDASVLERTFRFEMRVARRADVITTTSETLRDTYAIEAGRRAIVIENYLDEAVSFLHRRDGLGPALGDLGGLTIGWIAGAEHVADARALGVTEVLERLMRRHPELRVITVGLRLELESRRYQHHPWAEFEQLKHYINRFDIGIAPLSDIPMSHARSNVKVKEYAAVGTPWLASPRGTFAMLGPRQGGMLVEDGHWEAALEALITSRFKRLRLARRARAWARSQTIERHVTRWEDAFGEAIELASRGEPGQPVVVRPAPEARRRTSAS